MNRVARVVHGSALWRELSPRNRNHLLIGGISALAGAVAGTGPLLEGNLGEAIGVALNAGVMVFLGWAIARELDPDVPRSAFVAAALTAMILVGGSAPAGALVGVLLALRIVIRSTGNDPSKVDLLLLPLLAVAVAWLPRGWIGGVALAVALAWDTRLPNPGPRRNLPAAAVVLAAALGAAALRETFGAGFVGPDPIDWAAVAGGTLAFPAIRQYVPRSTCDRSRSRITPERLRAGRLLSLGAGLAAFIWFGGAAVGLLAGLWGALIGVAVHDRLIAARLEGRS